MSSIADAASQKMIRLKSSDGKTFEVDEAVFVESQTINMMIEADGADTIIALPDITSEILEKVIEYCKAHVDAAAAATETNSVDAGKVMKTFDAEFATVHEDTMLDICVAADSLKIDSLLDLACEKVANMMKGKSVEDMRKILGVGNDFTEDEEAEVQRMAAWAFE